MTRYADLTIKDILAQIPPDVEAPESHALIRRTYQYAEAAHRGQKRRSGEPYIQHPLSVAYMLAEFNSEPAVIAAGLLHDVLEDCDVTRADLRERFGKEVLVLVEGVTKLEAIEAQVKKDDRVRDMQELESLRKLLIAMAEDDIRIIFIKLADRLHNMRTLAALSPKNQLRMARETLEIFAPLANRLGIWVWKAALEDLSFRYLNPTMYHELAYLLDSRRDERQKRVNEHVRTLKAALAREKIPAKIKGRSKHIYSIYRKMRRKNVPFAQIYDAEGLRVIVDTHAQCYQVLGIVHQLWMPIPGEFDDYIAHPKPNGYQSLHTAVLSEGGNSLEIQIRTDAMDYTAEYGVATHWRYKEQDANVDAAMISQIAAMRQSVHDITVENGDARTFIDSIRSDVFQERVFVFTPKGKVIDLPFGATPIDFAYSVHTEIGHRCRGARVNGRWTALDYRLRTGERVEVVAAGRLNGPSRDWLNKELGFVKTNRARQKIKRWFRHQNRDENIARGRTELDKILKHLGLTFSMNEILPLFPRRYRQEANFLAALGMGDLTGETVVKRLEQHVNPPIAEELSDLEVIENAPPPPSSEPLSGAINVRGVGGLLTQIAKCCNPLPGEEIIGYVTRGRGVTIHRCDCPNVLQLTLTEQERLIEVEWGNVQQTFSVQILINTYDRAGLLYDVTGVLADQGINLSAMKTGKRDRYNIVPIYATLEIPNFSELTRVLAKIERVSNVIEARRIG